ncbi:MAG: ABC transporter ATP-binding protein/permease [Olsenella sp.]|nr:ABC transporter ATP-binding protein/permease [Olsenella sp.]
MSQRNTTRLERSTMRRTLQRFWNVTRMQPGITALAVISSAGYTLMLTFANTYVMGLVVDRVQASPVPASQVFAVFSPYVVALVLVNLVGQILSKLQDYSVYKLEINGNYHLSRLCFDTLSNQSMTFHTSNFGGALVSQTSRFTSGYSQLVDVVVFTLIPMITSIAATILSLVGEVPLFVAILVAMMVVYIAFVWVMYKRILPLSERTSQAQNHLSGVLSDAVTNILAVKTCGREDFERDLFTAADRDARQAETVSMRASMKRNFASSGIIVLIMAIVSVFMVGGNAWFGISAGTLVMMFTYTYNLTMRLNYTSSMMQRINRALGDAAEMTHILDEPRLVEDAPDASELRVTKGAIDFEHLGFRYHDAAEGDSVFEDLTLHIPAGQRVGLVGRSGSGKTTLTKLLLRLDDVQEGRVLVDGQDISRCTQQSLRRQIAYVPQEALLFHRSIRENIAYGRPDATEEQVRTAAAQANALEFIDRLPQGLDTMVGERGVKLSGGQRQRIAIARAILTDAPILVLDEATSALDSESEALVQEALERLMHGRTSIVVAHRLSTVASLDRIVVLSHGQIVEDGTHAELSHAGGEYERLWDRQTGGFLEGE